MFRIFIPLYVAHLSSLVTFKIFLFITVFEQFYYDVPQYSLFFFHFVCVCWVLCSFLDLQVYRFYQIWGENSTIISLNIFLSSPLLKFQLYMNQAIWSCSTGHWYSFHFFGTSLSLYLILNSVHCYVFKSTLLFFCHV